MSKKLEQQVERLLAENKALRAQSSLLNSILDNAPILISAKDLNGNILFVNQHFDVLEGVSPEEFIHKNVYDLFPYEIADALWKNDLQAQRSKKPIHADEVVYHKSGRPHTYHTTKFRLLDDDNHLIGTCAVSFDITDRKRLEQEVLHDFLTGLYNLKYLEENFERDLARAKRSQSMLVFAFIDLDAFKEINDHYGHDRGNDVLKTVASVLLEHNQRPDDISFRIGGDEFGFMLTVEDQKAIKVKIEAIHHKINSSIARLMDNATYQCTASMGVKFIHPDDDVVFFKSVYLEVDKALYDAKHQGKNRIVYIE